MVIYEVNLIVQKEIESEFARWLGPHIQEMLAFDGFERADWFERRAEDEGAVDNPERSVLWTVQYQIADRGHLEHYFVEHAAKMRGDGIVRFKGRFEASRRVLEVRERFAS